MIKCKIAGQILNGMPKTADKTDFVKWLESNEGMYFMATYQILGKHKCLKSKAQLGYYFALLVPEICKQLIHDGYTWDHTFMGITVHVPYNEMLTHELLTVLCGRVGENGDAMRLSDDDMTLERMIQYINNVLDVAGCHLNMNTDLLKAKRPEE